MVSIQPQVNMNGRYCVSATCKLLGIHRNTLLNYTKAGYIRCGFRANSKRKFYYGREIVRFWRAE